MKTTLKALPILTLAILATLPASADAQQESLQACYLPEVGALYLIQLQDLPTSCLSDDHTEISWSEGGADGGVADHGELGGLPDDDHPQYLLADGVRGAESGFAVTGTFGGGGAIPLEGEGARVMWYPDKAAFRAGSVDADQWDAANIGDHSVALGVNVQASATYSVALGRDAIASTFGSVALGNLVQASGNNSLAQNVATRALGHASSAMGHSTTASGFTAVSMNEATLAQGNNTLAAGKETIAQPTTSVAIGRWNTGSGEPNEWVDTDPLLMAGNGSSAASRSNALTLFKNGNLTIAGALTESSDARLKREVEPLDDALGKLRDIQPVRYRFREGTGHPQDVQIGLIAQEVEAVFPELVARDGEGFLSVAYPKLTAVLLQALQEQQDEIESGRAVIDDLRRRIDRLEAALLDRPSPEGRPRR